MKKILLILVATVFVVISAQAIPAYPKPIKVTQPDGSTITIRLYGDEHFHWTTTEDGYNIVCGEDGFYYYDAPNAPARIRANDAARRGAADRAVLSQTRTGMPAEGAQIARASRLQYEVATAQPNENNRIAREKAQAAGEKFRSLVILVNFSDVKFTISNPQQSITDLLNQNNYSANGGTGSAWNYYYDNSNGQFDGSFEVFGPFDINYGASYFTNMTSDQMATFVKSACSAAYASGVNFATYADNGYVRDIFFYYAGYNAAEGNSNTIWPHRWSIPAYTIGGVKVTGYACTSEYKGRKPSSGNGTMCGIGTFCHEFGHVLGWPDFYDTDNDSNGDALTPDAYSLMDYGPYSNNGRTPPALMAQERDMQGWLTNQQTLTATGNYTLPHVEGGYAYKILTPTSGEYFWIEMRGSTNKWDAGWNSNWGGMLITHVDRSSSYISRWNSNTLNNYSAHPCFLPIRANSTSTTYTYAAASTGWLFGNTVKALSSTTHPAFKAWNGATVAGAFTSMSRSGGTGSFVYTSDGTIILVEPESVNVSQVTGLLSIGESLQLTATVLPQEAADKTVTWSSDKTSVATVSSSGIVKGVAYGTATITATTINGKKTTCAITVIAQMSEITATMLQNDAILSWEYEWTGAFKIELQKGSENVGDYTTASNSVYIPILSPNTTYTATVYPVDGEGNAVGAARKTKTFKTIPNTSEFVAMGLMKGTFAATEQIPLRAINLPLSVKSIEWKVDGNAADAPAVTLATGKHVLTLTVVYDVDKIETITKTITVK